MQFTLSLFLVGNIASSSKHPLNDTLMIFIDRRVIQYIRYGA